MSTNDCIYSPAATRRPSALASLFSLGTRIVTSTATAVWNRRHLQRLDAMDKRMLQDIGLTPDDVARARLSDLGTDPTSLLQHAADQNIRRSL